MKKNTNKFNKSLFFDSILEQIIMDKVPNIDLHLHTKWTDGDNTVKQMHKAAISKGCSHILFSEHSRKASGVWFNKFADEVTSLNHNKCLGLVGTEVKSIRGGHVNIGEAYARFLNGELWLYNSNIGPYAPAGENHDPMRSRKLLLHRKELIRMQRALNEAPRATVVPLRLYLKRGFIKIEVGVAIGKRKYDKRQTIKKRDADREMRRARRHTARD